MFLSSISCFEVQEKDYENLSGHHSLSSTFCLSLLGSVLEAHLQTGRLDMVSENKNSGQDERQRAELQCEEQASRGQGGVSGLRGLCVWQSLHSHLVVACTLAGTLSSMWKWVILTKL